jgi:hypothetical protein
MCATPKESGTPVGTTVPPWTCKWEGESECETQASPSLSFHNGTLIRLGVSRALSPSQRFTILG